MTYFFHSNRPATYVADDMLLYPRAWMVVRDSCDKPEFFKTEEEARKNACLGLADTHIIPLYSPFNGTVC